MSNKRALFDAVVDEVEADYPLIKSIMPSNYIEAVEKSDTKYSLDENSEVIFHSPMSVFSDYTIRDAIMVKAIESEEFAFILLNKVSARLYANQEGKSDDDEVIITQDEMEALATVTHISVLWNQVHPAMNLAWIMSKAIESNSDIKVPALHSYTEKIVERVINDKWDFDAQREGIVKNLKELSLASLDE